MGHLEYRKAHAFWRLADRTCNMLASTERALSTVLGYPAVVEWHAGVHKCTTGWAVLARYSGELLQVIYVLL